MADEAGHEGQGAGPQVLDDGRHEGSGERLLEGATGRRVLGLVAVRDDHGRDPFLREARRFRKKSEMELSADKSDSLPGESPDEELDEHFKVRR